MAEENGNAKQNGNATFISGYPKLVDFEARFRVQEQENVSIRNRLVSVLKRQIRNCNVKQALLSYFPIINTFTSYNVKEYLPSDIIAGVTAGVMMIPQGMAFAALSTLPPIVGLYISLFASITYFFLGTGRQLSWGCIAILSLMMANILDKYDNSEEGISFISNLNQTNRLVQPYGHKNNSDAGAFIYILNNNTTDGSKTIDVITERRIEVASSVSVIAGLIIIIASRVGLSRITAIMSNSLITGFTVGISVHVATSQLKGILGLPIERYKGIGQLIRTWIAILERIPETNVAALIISVISMLIIYLVKKFVNEKFKDRMKVPIPIELFVVITATLVSTYTRLDEKYDVKIVEDVPVGIPKPKFPDISLVADYIGDALVIIVVAYAQSLAMAKTMGLKHNYIIDSNQEMLATGACSVVCGLFSGYITGASVSRSVVQDGAGGKTQIASLFSAGMVLLVIMLIGPYFYYLPTCVLSAIIVINLRTMFLKFFTLPSEWKKSKFDCAIWMFACVATVILNADIGLFASIIFSLLLVVFRTMINPVEVVGQIQTSTTAVQLRSLANYMSIHNFPAVKLIKITTSLFFINSDAFTTAVFEKTEVDPINVKVLKAKGLSKSKKTKTAKSKGASVLDAFYDNDETSRLFNMKVLIIDISELSFIDVMGVKALEFIIDEYASIGIEVLFISVPENIFGMLQSTGFWKKQGDRLFLNVEAALASIAAAVETQDKSDSDSQL